MINLKLNIERKSKNHIKPQTNNFFLEYSQLNLRKKQHPKQLNSFRDFTKYQFTQLDDEKEPMLTDRDNKKSHKQQTNNTQHKRANSTTKKSTAYHQTSMRHPTPSTGVSTKFNNPQGSANDKLQKNKEKQLYKGKVVKDSLNNTKTMNRNISSLGVKMVKKKLILGNNSNIGDQLSLKGTIPGWPGQKVIQKLGLLLTQYQKQQLTNQKQVYYIGVVGVGQDDTNGAYLWKKHEQLGFRYQLLQHLGSGAFGQVIKAYDHKNKQQVAVKIIRSKKQHMQLALNQINILMKVKQKDVQNQKNILRIKDFIVFRKHICIITQLLSISLYELLESNNFARIEMTYIRTFAIQILNALVYLKEIRVVHSDLKPENVMLKNKSKTGIKLIDFGTSMFSNETNYLYIQSRFYRAPQVILGAPYAYEIDMWSLGCLLAQLYLGQPIFAGKDQTEQLALIMECVGVPENQQFLKKCRNLERYFNAKNTPKTFKDSQGKVIRPNSKQLLLLIQDKLFCQYLSKILVINPKHRYTPLEALLDPWIMQGLPQEIKHQHLAFIKAKMKEEKKNKDKQLQIKHKKTTMEKKGHKRQNTADMHVVSKRQQNCKRQEQNLISTAKKTSIHARRNSEFKYEQFNAKTSHLKHKRKGSAGFC